ncbi:phosphodiesterase [Amylibacter marinus]|uniref:Phosphodiesterase n=1 Tax=Amylibacter marinus TaxID=1475483 RepID=A0ABQ5VW94_9RHOB|nr:glycerophosphodiester phosphodiesterase family protein [Amylibacter marinus]GLQ35690.1 phosphodiesterase [Amylibacter marinus]
MKSLSPFADLPICHRTLHDIDAGRPENSWEGLEAAIQAGLPVEIDVQVSADGVAMVFHDYDLVRLTGRQGLVNSLPADELVQIPLLGGQRGIPRLDEFLAHVDGRIPVLIELKDQDGGLQGGESPLEASVCELLRDYTGDVAVMSFNPYMIARCAMLASHVPRGLVTDPFTRADWPDVSKARRTELALVDDYARLDCMFISHNVSDLAAPVVRQLKKAGAHVFCWTVRSAEVEARARRVVDNITFEGYTPEIAR